MPLLACSCSSRNMRASCKTCVLLASRRHRRALHRVPVCVADWSPGVTVCWAELPAGTGELGPSVIAYGKKTQRRGSLCFLFSFHTYFIEEILQTTSPDFPQKLGHPPWSAVEDPVTSRKLLALTHCAVYAQGHNSTTGKPPTPAPLAGKNLCGPTLWEGSECQPSADPLVLAKGL